MRALIVALVVAAVAAGGYFFYRQSAPAPAENVFAPPVLPPAPTIADCAAENARYVLRGDPRMHMRFVIDPETPAPRSVGGGMEMAPTRPLLFVLTITTKAEEHLFAPVVTEGYQRNMLLPIVNGRRVTPRPGDQMQVSLFDADLGYIAGAPHPDDRAPAHIFAPDLTRYIYNLGGDRRVDAPVGFFDYQNCPGAEAAP